ncbi:MAG: hypothetical protein M3Y86_00590 [Verrucomicrobiota bacterium]|nr:hypothetical protein [Verrucomicrobiota bacterium]
MGRRFFTALVAASLLSPAMAREALAQNPSAPDGGGGRRMNPQFRAGMRERWRTMSPEDRQHFKSNVERWLAMPPEQRRALREQEGMRRERLRREADAVMRDSGLQLEPERRAQFEQRYLQERRRIDRELRQELQERRQRELAPVLERLKKDFAQPQNSAATPAGSAAAPASASPTK